ncbi:uncharacterized protein LOC132733034 [Ruditapes philippinarum]|uniref:uncharacterized protein LOC132733034 n=1 Tax=Ruditapes philippinarum TaxID=129788 RepID=UPI00295C3A55|nr:uncharacterized protein LOC132733034 [Ruditapes philippinarum]
MRMFRLAVASVAILCLNQVVADNHACDTESKKTEVNNLVDGLGQDLASIMNSQASQILTAVCNTSETDGAYKKIKDIETLVGQCRALIETTNLTTINLGGLTFKDMFERFSSVDNFCGCKQALIMANAMNMFTNTLRSSPTGAKYPFIQVSALCSDDTAKGAVRTVSKDIGMCPQVWKYAELLNDNNVKLMQNFVENECSKLNNANFTCAVEQSKTDTFKNCIMEADKSGEDRACERRDCAAKFECGKGSVWYMLAVNMEKNGKDTFSTDACNGVSSAVASISVLLLGALFTVLLY